MVDLLFLPFRMMLTRKLLKAHEVLSVEYLSPLMVKSSSEVMSSHIQMLV